MVKIRWFSMDGIQIREEGKNVCCFGGSRIKISPMFIAVEKCRANRKLAKRASLFIACQFVRMRHRAYIHSANLVNGITALIA
jgi:hypothetical protein